MIHLYGLGHPAAIDLVGDYMFPRIDVETDGVVGFQIEDFLGQAIRDEPQLLDFLDAAELNGITLEEIAERRRAIPDVAWKRTLLASLFQRQASTPTSATG